MSKITPSKNVALGSIASLVAASSANAIIQSGSPVSGSGIFLVDWDIDGNSTIDFSLSGTTSSNSFSTSYCTCSGSFSTVLYSYGARFSIFPQNGAKFASNNYGGLAPISNAAVVNNHHSFMSTTAFASAISSFRSWTTSNGLSSLSSGATYIIGFSFSREGNTHYGIASFNFNITPFENAIDISDVYWNDVPNQGITGAGLADPAAVPEPETFAFCLGALALGAAGLRRWRKNKALNA